MYRIQQMPAKKTAASAKVEAYCVKCKHARSMDGGKLQKTSNGRHMMCGKCETCGTKMCKFLSDDAAKKMKGGGEDEVKMEAYGGGEDEVKMEAYGGGKKKKDDKKDEPMEGGKKKKSVKKDDKK